MKNKPIWLLDFDGVINACCRPYQFPTVWPRDTWEAKQINGFLIQWSTEVVDFINAISSDVDIRWHSTWGAENLTHVLEAELGLEHFTVTDGRISDGMEMHWWKMPTAVDIAFDDNECDIIWTDDDLFDSQKAKFLQYEEGRKFCLITPKTHIGLTPEHLKQIKNLVAS